MTDCLAKQD